MTLFPDRSRWQPASSVEVSLLGQEAALLDEKSGLYFGLDEVGTTIWGFVQRSLSVAEMIAGLTEEYAVPQSVAADDLRRFLATLEQRGLIEAADSASS